MLSRRPMGPSLLGYAFGFGLAGSGVGVVAAMVTLRFARSAVGELPELVQWHLLYGTILANAFVDAVIGMLAGVIYARYQRRAGGSR